MTHPATGRPQCSNCDFACPSGLSTSVAPLCATDGQTYASWCALRRASCLKGVILETRHAGRCGGGRNNDDDDGVVTSSPSGLLERKFVSFPFGKSSGARKGGKKAGKYAAKKKLSKKERRARRRMQRRQRLQAKAALLAETRKAGVGLARKKFTSRRNGAKFFKHPQSSLAVKRAAPSNNDH